MPVESFWLGCEYRSRFPLIYRRREVANELLINFEISVSQAVNVSTVWILRSNSAKLSSQYRWKNPKLVLFLRFSIQDELLRVFNPFLLSKSVAKARRYPTYDTRKENDNIYGSSNPLFPPEALFPFHSKSLRHRSKGDLSSAARPPCTMHASRSEENRIPAQTGTFRAVFASRPQQPPFPLSHTLHVSCAFEYDQRELT